jgi:hypothetical protein
VSAGERRSGRYKLLERVGEGGMGEVRIGAVSPILSASNLFTDGMQWPRSGRRFADGGTHGSLLAGIAFLDTAEEISFYSLNIVAGSARPIARGCALLTDTEERPTVDCRGAKMASVTPSCSRFELPGPPRKRAGQRHFIR